MKSEDLSIETDKDKHKDLPINHLYKKYMPSSTYKYDLDQAGGVDDSCTVIHCYKDKVSFIMEYKPMNDYEKYKSNDSKIINQLNHIRYLCNHKVEEIPFFVVFFDYKYDPNVDNVDQFKIKMIPYNDKAEELKLKLKMKDEFSGAAYLKHCYLLRETTNKMMKQILNLKTDDDFLKFKDGF